jgi:cytochrome c oxidase subunit 2
MVVLMRPASMRTPVLLLLVIASAAFEHSTPQAQSPAPRIIEITAERFEFWPSEVTITEGQPVQIRLRSDDTMHGFRLIGHATNVLIPKRGKGYAPVTLPDLKPGRYTFECSRLCGAGHNFMRGVLVVKAAGGNVP